MITTRPETFDAIVVGSGAGGGFAAMALAEAGMRVLLLERGRRFEPRRDFPMTYPDWELRPRAFRDTEVPAGHDASLVLEDGAPLDPRYAHLRSSSTPDEEAKRLHRAPFRYERVFGLGGTTLHYQGEAHRFSEHAMSAPFVRCEHFGAEPCRLVLLRGAPHRRGLRQELHQELGRSTQRHSQPDADAPRVTEANGTVGSFRLLFRGPLPRASRR